MEASSIEIQDVKKKEKKPHVNIAKETIKTDCVCPICHDILLNPVTPPCGHSLCEDCFKELKSKNSYDLKCPMCQRKIQDKNLSINLVMSGILKKFGGSSYIRRLERDTLSKEYKNVFDKYFKSSRYELIRSMLRNYLEEHQVVDYDDIIVHYIDYDANELTLILCKAFLSDNSDIVLHGNKLIHKTKVIEYMKANPDLTSKDEINLLMSWLNNKHDHNDDCELKKVVNHISHKYRSMAKNTFWYPFLDIRYPRSCIRVDLKKRDPLIKSLIHLITQEKKSKMGKKFTAGTEDCACDECRQPFFADCIDDDEDEPEEEASVEVVNVDIEMSESSCEYEYEYENEYGSYSSYTLSVE